MTFEKELTASIAHISDVHFGRIADGRLPEALLHDIAMISPTLTVVSGDLTQRAFPHQYREARAFIDRLSEPRLIVPGNHDVYPWWRPVLRLRDPLRRFRNWISPDFSTAYVGSGIAVFGLNTAFGGTIKGGRILESQRLEMQQFFSTLDGSDQFRVIVLHHAPCRLSLGRKHDMAIGGESLLAAAARSGVRLVLCGHLHTAHAEEIRTSTGDRMIVAAAGTATSDRSRDSRIPSNSWFRIHVFEAEFKIEERHFNESQGIFEPGFLRSWSR